MGKYTKKKTATFPTVNKRNFQADDGMNMTNFYEYLPKELTEAALQFLQAENILSMKEDEDDGFAILVQEGDLSFYVCLLLDSGFYIDDIFCPECHVHFCVHSVAALFAAQLMVLKGSSYEEALRMAKQSPDEEMI